MNEEEQKQKVAGELTAREVSMIKMPIKVDTGCRDLALPESLVKRLNLTYVETVRASSSTDNQVPTDRYGTVLVFWEDIVCSTKAYCMPKLDSALLGLQV